jgi:hypothetical protein
LAASGEATPPTRGVEVGVEVEEQETSKVEKRSKVEMRTGRYANAKPFIEVMIL